MYFGAQTTENTFGAFIYDYARCSKNADLDSASASQVLLLFWAMMMVGRFAGIFISTRISPTLYWLVQQYVQNRTVLFAYCSYLKFHSKFAEPLKLY